MADHEKELIDVLDDSGNPTGEKKTYNEIHAKGYLHRVFHAWILSSEGELLIQRRSPAIASYPDKWDISFAGHTDSGETSLDSAVREGGEELGIDVKKEGLQFLFTVDSPRTVMNSGAYINHELQDVYLVRMPRDAKFHFSDHEVAEVKWVPWRDLERIVKSGDPAFVPHRIEYEGLFAYLRSAAL